MKDTLTSRFLHVSGIVSLLILSACSGDNGDASPPVLVERTPIATSDNRTPSYTFNSTEAGTISYGGDCSSSTTKATIGNNTIVLNDLDPGTYSGCTLQITDAAGNKSSILTISDFVIEYPQPKITEVTAVPSPTGSTPSYTFNSTDAGEITYGGSCSSSTTDATVGDNTVIFNTLAVGTYSDCTITVTIEGNDTYILNPSSQPLSVNTFTVIAPPTAVTLDLDYEQTKIFKFSWTDVPEATTYKLMENPDGSSGFVQLGSDIASATQVFEYRVPLYARTDAKYMLQSCNAAGCTDSNEITVNKTSMVKSIGYLKANTAIKDGNFGRSVSLSNDGLTLATGAPAISGNYGKSGQVYVFTRTSLSDEFGTPAEVLGGSIDDLFGEIVSLSGDGNTLAVSAREEDSAATGINGDQDDNTLEDSGAVYVFTRAADNTWTQQAYIKASNPDSYDYFGATVSLSDDGNTLAVNAYLEDSSATDINGDEDDNSASDSGAAYIFTRAADNTWTQQAYIKASNSARSDRFGSSLNLSDDGNTLAVAAIWEDSSATGINGDEDDNSAHGSGAVYVFTRANNTWTQQAYIKASNTDKNDYFGGSVSLNDDGNTLAVAARGEGSAATGIGGNQDDDNLSASGAVYVFTRAANNTWAQQAYIKASNSEWSDQLGTSVSLSSDGNTLAVGMENEDSAATGINGDEDDNSASSSGAVYVFTRANNTWIQQAYVKASNTGKSDFFGKSVSLSDDGNILAVGAFWENSKATGINGDQNDDTLEKAGAVYIY